jgi:hypothetical protein
MFRRFLIPALVTLALLFAAGFVSAAGATHVTAPRLERSLPTVFANLYAQQELLQGKPVIPADQLHAQAQCMRIGANGASDGPGGDWACLVSWQDPTLPMPPEGWGRFELNVRSNGCYSATGPSKLVGLLTIADAQGKDVTNPLNEFDACFDPQADNTPTGVSFPALISVTSTSLTSTEKGVSPTVVCTLGSGRCVGTVTATIGAKTLGEASYDLNAGISGPLALPRTSSTKPVTLTFHPTEGKAPSAPIVLPVTGPISGT